MMKLNFTVSGLLGALLKRNSRPFELRVAANPELIDDVHGRTVCRHPSLAEALRSRRRYYRSCVEAGTTPLPLVTVEVRETCIVRYLGMQAWAVYGKGVKARVENLRAEMSCRVEDVLAV